MENNKVLDFLTFLNESKGGKKKEKIKIVVLTGNSEDNKTGDSFVKESKKRGFSCYLINVNQSILTIGQKEKDFIENDGKEFEISKNDTVFIPRRGVISNSYTKKIMLQIQKAGYFTLNSLESMDICENKYVTAQVMEEYNLPVPKYSLIQNEEYLDGALNEIGGKFPVIMKLLSGTQGIGVSIVDSYASYKYNLSEKLKEIACNAAGAVGCHWCGVDIMIDSGSKKPYILEVNSSPGTEGISKAIGVPIVSKIIDYIEDKDNWVLPEYSIGYLETVSIPGIGEMVAKFDTGNGGVASSMHVDKIEKKGKYIVCNVGSRTLKYLILDTTKVRTGKVTALRYIIETDIEFNGRIYRNVKISPVDRTDFSTPFLVNRGFMQRLGVSIDPDKKFTITSKLSGYEEKESKGNSEGGIDFE